MIIKTITDKKAFDAFVEQHPYSHYMKTSMWGEYKQATDGLKYEMLGFYESDTLIGTAMHIFLGVLVSITKINRKEMKHLRY